MISRFVLLPFGLNVLNMVKIFKDVLKIYRKNVLTQHDFQSST